MSETFTAQRYAMENLGKEQRAHYLNLRKRGSRREARIQWRADEERSLLAGDVAMAILPVARQ